MVLNQTSTPRKSAAKTAIVRGVREYQRAQTPKIKNTSASASRSPAPGQIGIIDRQGGPPKEQD